MTAFFHCEGNLPSKIDVLNSVCITDVIGTFADLSITAIIPSGPGDLLKILPYVPFAANLKFCRTLQEF